MESCWDWITNYLYEERTNRIMDNKPSSYPLYSELTKNDTVKVLKHKDESKYIKDIDLDDLHVDKTLSKKYNVYYKYTTMQLPRGILAGYRYDQSILLNILRRDMIYMGNAYILIIIKDKHDKDYEQRYIFKLTDPYNRVYPVDKNDEHLELCRKLISELV